MNATTEIIKIKNELKLLNSRLNKTQRNVKKFEKILKEKILKTQKRKSRSISNYVNWLENERMNRNLVSND